MATSALFVQAPNAATLRSHAGSAAVCARMGGSDRSAASAAAGGQTQMQKQNQTQAQTKAKPKPIVKPAAKPKLRRVVPTVRSARYSRKALAAPIKTSNAPFGDDDDHYGTAKNNLSCDSTELQVEHEMRAMRGFGGRLENCPALVLNSDYQPLSYMPLSLWPWQEVMKAVFLGRVEILATYDVSVRSARAAFLLPSVVCLKKYQQSVNKNPAFSRFNVFLRDDFRCQYCNTQQRASDLTFDHVVPRSRGGRSTWTNIVSACMDCNNRKGNKVLSELPGMKLVRPPRIPSYHELQVVARQFPPAYLHESWLDYVYWDNPLQDDEVDASEP